MKNKKKAILITIFAIFYVVALLMSMNSAERRGVYWLNPDYAVGVIKNNDFGFYTVDISQTDELTKIDDKKISENHITHGEIHHLPDISEFELFLYNALAKNGGYLTEDDLQKLKTLHVRIISQPGTPVDEFYDFLFQDKSEEYLTQKLSLTTKDSKQADTSEVKEHISTRKLTYSTHKVRKGETLWNIAKNYGISTQTLLSANSDILSADGSNLKLGITLRIPNKKGIFITTAKGDTISNFAKKYNVPIKSILIANNKTSSELQIGEKLFIPGARALPPTQEKQVKVKITTQGGKRLEKYTVASEGKKTQRKGYFVWPLKSKITLSSKFGRRQSPFRRARRRAVFHAGIDLRAPRGTPIYASASGIVTFSGWRSGYGKTVEIIHSNGIKTIYAHCSRLHVRSGESVKIGQPIATVGATGRATGNHLHFEIRVNEIPRNPFSYLR